MLATEISPELVPGDGDKPAQSTEQVVGPYPLQDFNLFYLTRYGLAPSKVAYLAWNAWRDVAAGHWPPGIPESVKQAYDLATIKRLAAAVPLSFLSDQPVQALGGPERSEGRLRRLAVAARRLARAERFRGRRLDRRTRRRRSR